MRREVEAVREREVHERRVQPLVAQLAAEVPQVRARRAAQHLGPRVGHHLKEDGLFKQVIYSFLVLNNFITSIINIAERSLPRTWTCSAGTSAARTGTR